ncbi:MAG: NADase-type glycan-binding domain-containing protein [Pseudonocardiaceae bacterium]
MIVCRTCGGHNADADTFCGSCGTFLEWTGEKIQPAVEPTTSRPAEPSTPRPAEPTTPRPVEPITHRPAEPTTPRPVEPITHRPAVPVIEPIVQPPLQPPLQPQPKPQPKPQPVAMTPQPSAPRRPTATVTPSPPTRVLQPDDLICGDCGEGNPPTRRFCSRCGGSLHTATVVPTPWWRQFLKRFDRTSRPVGSRPSRFKARTLRGVSTTIRRVLLVGVLLLGLLAIAVPSVRSLVIGGAVGIKNRVEALFVQQYDPVRPTSSSATDEVPDHEAGLAVDGFTNTFWSAADAAAEPTLVLGFDRPTQLVRAIVWVGGGEDPLALGRPKQLHLVYSADGATIGTSDVMLLDTPGKQQEVKFEGGDGATSVEIHVVDVHRSTKSSGVALSEIELFERR